MFGLVLGTTNFPIRLLEVYNYTQHLSKFPWGFAQTQGQICKVFILYFLPGPNQSTILYTKNLKPYSLYSQEFTKCLSDGRRRTQQPGILIGTEGQRADLRISCQDTVQVIVRKVWKLGVTKIKYDIVFTGLRDVLGSCTLKGVIGPQQGQFSASCITNNPVLLLMANYLIRVEQC